MTEYTVVVNDCAAVAVTGGPVSIRTRDTAHGSQNFTLNFAMLAAGLPRQLNDRELDWLETVGHIYAIDLACKRGEGDVAWARDIDVHLPVRDPEFWNSIAARVEQLFGDFTMDRLRVSFVANADPPEAPRQGLEAFPEHDSVALLSGGVDSFVGAALLIDRGERPISVAHTAAGAITHAQALVEEQLAERQPSFQRLGLTARKSGSTFPSPEASQRSRSLLFLGAAAVVAVVGGTNRVYINENGVMAIHLPMTNARIGSLSTHTAAPIVMDRVAALATDVLGQQVTIINELVSFTKPQVVELGLGMGLQDALAETVSCWSIGRTSEHCGVCAPCLMRRISFVIHGAADALYKYDAFDDPDVLLRNFAADNLTHLVRLVDDIRGSNDLELQVSYPELLNGASVLSVSNCIALYRQWADEAASVLFARPVPQSVR
jgi:7-cyano-7-deazaguanine synthase in queuosine biosynthesis